MNNGRDCPHGRQVGKCDTCDLIKTELELQQVTAERDALAAQVGALKNALSKCRFDSLNQSLSEWAEIQATFEFTPQHHLAAHDAEVAAKAVEEFSEFAVNELRKTVVVAYSGCRGTDSGDLSDLSVMETDEFSAIKTEYATQLRAKVGA